MSGDWAELNTDLLHLILQKLETFSNFIRFRSVCKWWRSAVGPTEYFPHLPWIIYSTNGSNPSPTDYVIYSLSSNTTCQINLPKNHKECRKYLSNDESSSGFFLLKHNVSKSSYLFNPLTGTKIYPPLSKDDLIFFILYMGLHLNGTLQTMKSGVRLVFCELLIDACFRKNKLQVGLWKYDNNFINFEIPFLSGNMAYYKDKLFAYWSQTTKTRIFDINTGAEIGIPIQDTVGNRRQFLVVAIEDLFRVVMELVTGHPYKFQFNVYRLEHTNNFEQCRWMELKGIGDRILFIGLYQGCANSFCLSASVVNGLKGNCIYYVHYYHVLRYNMEDGTTDYIYRFPAPSARWYMPNLI